MRGLWDFNPRPKMFAKKTRNYGIAIQREAQRPQKKTEIFTPKFSVFSVAASVSSV
jgi:hypothetical protein